jgi:hypothetical protein
MGEERNVCKVVMGKLEGKRPLGRSSVDGIRFDFRETGCRAGGGSSWLSIGAGGRLL